MSGKGRILVAMSGGIDSSMAAVMLHEQGFEVIGITMKTWDYATAGGTKKETGCCSLDSINDARNIAVQTGFPHYIIDLREEFGNNIIENFVGEYLSGRTPNPCVLCNTFIKWEALLLRAGKLNCDRIATGHYAKIRNENGRFLISRGIDDTKDQSYVLWGVSQQNLARTLFPLGDLSKKEIRQMATQYGFIDLVNKSESYEICFIPDNDYRSFLKRKAPEEIEKIGEGKMTLRDGTEVGTHDGYPFFTIGQRKGLKIALGEPMYVVDIKPETNTVVLGSKEDLMGQTMKVEKINLIKYEKLSGNLEAVTKIRYKDRGAASTISQENNSVHVKFHQPVSAITPGQSAVFYEGDDIVGGGIISH